MTFKLTVEIPFFLVVFSFMLTNPINNNLLIYRTCYTLLHYNETECALLGFVENNITKRLETLVEPTANYIGLVKHIIESILGSVLCMFIAPWTDRFGRKPVMVMGLVGGLIAGIMMIGYAAITSLTPWYTLVLMIPFLLGGGGPTFITVLHAYLIDITTEEKRGFRIGIFDGVMGIAILTGNAASAYVLKATSYVAVYFIPVISHILALLFTILFIPESLQNRESENKVSGMFDLSNIRQMAKTPFKRRENANRSLLLLIMSIMCITPLMAGAGAMMFNFLRAKMQWTLVQYTWFGTANNLLGMFGLFFVIYLLHTLLKIRDTKLICVGTIFSIISAILTGLADKDWHIYLAAVINIPNGGQSALTKSFMSKLVPKDEVAKIFSITGIFSSILGLVGSTVYTLIYNSTIETDPGIFNFVTAGILTVCLIILLIILIIQEVYPSVSYRVLDDESVESTVTEDNNIYNGISTQHTVST